jgi:hypothetical protein
MYSSFVSFGCYDLINLHYRILLYDRDAKMLRHRGPKEFKGKYKFCVLTVPWNEQEILIESYVSKWFYNTRETACFYKREYVNPVSYCRNSGFQTQSQNILSHFECLLLSADPPGKWHNSTLKWLFYLVVTFFLNHHWINQGC